MAAERYSRFAWARLNRRKQERLRRAAPDFFTALTESATTRQGTAPASKIKACAYRALGRALARSNGRSVRSLSGGFYVALPGVYHLEAISQPAIEFSGELLWGTGDIVTAHHVLFNAQGGTLLVISGGIPPNLAPRTLVLPAAGDVIVRAPPTAPLRLATTAPLQWNSGSILVVPCKLVPARPLLTADDVESSAAKRVFGK